MPYLIDGNNLIYALDHVHCHVGREGLTELLEELVSAGERVCVVYDGAPPEGLPSKWTPVEGLLIRYAAPVTADDIIIQRIRSATAPRQLTVVSSDREIRDAARKRRCRPAPSEVFAPALLAELERLRRAEANALPPEKFFGLSSLEQRKAWLQVFGMPELAEEPEDPVDRYFWDM